jgi:shikimate dehydrogenase
MSLAGRPGTFGSRFHNHLFGALGLDYIYKAFTTTDLPGAIRGLRAFGIRGCAVSMPFKEACIPMLDSLAASASAVLSVNTIVNDDGRLEGHNTDYGAIRTLLARHAISPDASFVLRGSGGMAKAVVTALRDAGFARGTIVARNQASGAALAAACGYAYASERELATLRAPLLVNVTPLGMEGTEARASAFPDEAILACDVAFDVVARPRETPFVASARARRKKVVTGLEVIALQALDQFVLYTGLRPGADQVSAAVAFATEELIPPEAP